VNFDPETTYFKPAGIPLNRLEEVVMTPDELEALRLKNILDLDQNQAAERMKVSQPTFHRIMTAAVRKVTEALVNGKAIRLEKKR
jgi:predicted DNA-binding protein (UPF0251 family)